MPKLRRVKPDVNDLKAYIFVIKIFLTTLFIVIILSLVLILDITSSTIDKSLFSTEPIKVFWTTKIDTFSLVKILPPKLLVLVPSSLGENGELPFPKIKTNPDTT